MALEIKKAGYFNITVESSAEAGYKLLSLFAGFGISLLAFKAIQTGQNRTRFSLFPDNSSLMKEAAAKSGLEADGPHTALIIKSNSDEPGECAGVFKKLSLEDVDVFEYNGIADIYGSYGIVLYLKEEDCEKAIEALKA